MAVQTFIDGTEVTDVVLDGSVTRRLNRPAQATVRIPIDAAIGDAGSRLKVVIDGTLHFHGMVLLIEDQCDEDFGYTTYNATDPMELWQWRLCRDYLGPTEGNFINPSFLQRYGTAPQVVQSLLLASDNPLLGHEDTEGPLFVVPGFFEGGGVNISGAPTNWPMTIGEMVALLVSTGELDVILTPIDSGGNMAQVDCYNGHYGTDRTGSVLLDYATGNHNVRELRQAVDMSNVANKIQYFLGPKETLTRYKANITGDDPCLYIPPGGDIDDVIPHNIIGARRRVSQTNFGVRFEFQEFDVDVVSRENPTGAHPGPIIPCGDPARDTFRTRWQQESWIRAVPRTLVHVTPVRYSDNNLLPPGVNPVVFGDFDIGDIVRVRAGAFVRGGFDGGQRVYAYTVAWDVDGVIALGEIQTSSDQEGV